MEQEAPKKQPKIIVVAGIERSGSSFISTAICEAVRLAGYTYQYAENLSKGDFKEKWQLDGQEVESLSESNLKEVDFIVLRVLDYSIELEAKANLIFCSTRNPYEIINSMQKINIGDERKYGVKNCLDGFENLISWMRSGKLAYCMDFNSPFNKRGLHNYNNLRNIILPMNYRFAPINLFKDLQGNDLNPKDLIEAIVPELKEKSEEAKTNFDQKLTEIKEEQNGAQN